MCMHCAIITTIKLINIPITSHSHCVCVCVCVCVVKPLEIYSPPKFLVCNILLLTAVTMLYIRISEFIHLITESCTL